MIEIAKLFASIGADLSGLEAGLSKAAGMLESAGRKMNQVGNALSVGVTLPLTLMGKAAAGATIELDKQMRNIQSIGGQTEEELDALSQTFVGLSTDITKTTDSAALLARGFYDIQSSGFYGADAMELLTRSTKAAAAGLSNTQTAAKAITATLNAYGKGAESAAKVSDIMFKTVDKGVVTFEELSMSLSNTLSSAANAGIEFEVVGAAIATMTKQGLDAAEATVSLNQVILSLIDPSENLKEALHNLGYESGAAALQNLGLAGTLGLLEDAGYDSTEEMAKLFNNVRALRGVLSLTGAGAQMFASDLENMYQSAGSTEEAFAVQTQSLSAQLAILRNKAVAFGMGLVETTLPAMQDGIDTLGGLLDGFRSLDSETQRTIVNIGLLAAAAGPAFKILAGGIAILQGLAKATLMLQGALLATPAFIADVAAAFSLLAGGAGFFSVASLGAAGLLAALTPLVAVVGALAGVWYTWQQTVVKTNEEGKKAASNAWADFFAKQAASGKDAAAIFAEYMKAQESARNALANTSPILRAFIGDQDQLIGGWNELSATMKNLSPDYDTYANSLQQAADAAGLQIDAEGNLIRMMNVYGAALPSVIQANYLLERSQFESGLAAKYAGSALESEALRARNLRALLPQVAQSTDKLAEAQASLAEKGMAVDEVMKLAQASLSAAGLSGMQLDAALNQLGLTLGAVTQEQLFQQQMIDALSMAYSNGAIGLDTYTNYMQQVGEGSQKNSPLLLTQIQTMNTNAEANRNAAAAAQELVIKQLNLAEALKGATKAQIAQTAIDELTAAYEAGTLAFPDYVTAVEGVQTTFGLADEKSRLLAEGIGLLVSATSTGLLPAQNFDEALKNVITNASNGLEPMQGIIEKFGLLPENVDPATLSVQTYADTTATLPEVTQTAITKVEETWRAAPWKQLGIDAGTGIAAGITAATPAIAAAARAAALKALAAARAALGVESPSKEFAKLGKMSAIGMAIGMRGEADMLKASVRAALAGMLTLNMPRTASSVTHTVYEGDTNINQEFYDPGAAALAMAKVKTLQRARLNASFGR